MGELFVGFNISKVNLDKTLVNYPCNAFQIAISPLVSNVMGSPIKNNLIINEIMKKKHIYGVAHGKYIYNFARKEINPDHFKTLINDIELAKSIGINIILHQGKNLTELKQSREEALNNYVKHITYILKQTTDIKIVLENSARQGTELGYTIDELKEIYELFDNSLRNRIMFCIDLCHIFVAGELDVRNGSDVKKFINEFNNKIGLNKLECFHFNDSAVEFNGRNDHHADITKGFIGSKSLDGFTEIAKIAKKHKIPLILETPTDELYQIELIKDLLN
jgi:apurinic endonuclease APN1